MLTTLALILALNIVSIVWARFAVDACLTHPDLVRHLSFWKSWLTYNTLSAIIIGTFFSALFFLHLVLIVAAVGH